ncbi:GNAT family N-acetyltransferase [Pseudovibrio sp. Tun.PSC04-5.I4]|uniref:GNAT family N-acetyltransferase n=1 Tax=Pseudovibrio sp. Tun.PSC04-5.I4 TaxID=1798213 RepID=UPI00088AEBA7|nr:GNAT family N-acetyltransferase [Pseudovibrio sp. Tun.PSC04-5.I4]SDQ19796.1 Ribosomal protein S18 acetylase RimI [Pseudovibrio sp. Tun.PSC04-5.I4]
MSSLAPFITLRQLIPDDFMDVAVLLNELTEGVPVADRDEDRSHFSKLLSHEGTSIFGLELEGTIVSCATLHILPNMTYGGRPYCLAENVVTLRAHQGRGYGKLVMNTLKEAAWSANAYKIMLLTGQDRGVKGFYESLGYTADQKFGMVLRRVPTYKPPQAEHTGR